MRKETEDYALSNNGSIPISICEQLHYLLDVKTSRGPTCNSRPLLIKDIKTKHIQPKMVRRRKCVIALLKTVRWENYKTFENFEKYHQNLKQYLQEYYKLWASIKSQNQCKNLTGETTNHTYLEAKRNTEPGEY